MVRHLWDGIVVKIIPDGKRFLARMRHVVGPEQSVVSVSRHCPFRQRRVFPLHRNVPATF